MAPPDPGLEAGMISQDSETPASKDKEHRVLQGPSGPVTLVISSYQGPPPFPPVPPLFASSGDADDVPMEEDIVLASSSRSSIATLCNSAVGAGVLSLPFAFREAGALGGVLMCLGVGLCEGFTLYVLSKLAERYRRQSYAQLVRATLGRKLSAVIAAVLVVLSFGSSIAYMIIIGDTFSTLAKILIRDGDDSMLGNRHVIIAVIGAGFILPLCLTRRLGALASLSSLAVVGFLFTSLVVVWEGYKAVSARDPDPFAGVVWLKWDVGVLYALPIITFGFNCHTNVIPVFNELTSEPVERMLRMHVREGKTVKLVNMIEVIVVALGLLMAGYLAVGLAGYLGYPTVTSNVLNVLPATAIVQVIRGLIALIVLVNCPLVHFPAREAFQDALTLAGWAAAAQSDILSVAFTFCFIGGAMGIAMVVTDLGLVLNIIGGTAASFLIFFTPGLMLINEAIRKHSNLTLHQMEEDEHDGVTPAASVVGSTLWGTNALSTPLLLHDAATKGIKKTGLIYSPGKSWAAGLFLVSLSLLISSITIVTALLPVQR